MRTASLGSVLEQAVPRMARRACLEDHPRTEDSPRFRGMRICDYCIDVEEFSLAAAI